MGWELLFVILLLIVIALSIYVYKIRKEKFQPKIKHSITYEKHEIIHTNTWKLSKGALLLKYVGNDFYTKYFLILDGVEFDLYKLPDGPEPIANDPVGTTMRIQYFWPTALTMISKTTNNDIEHAIALSDEGTHLVLAITTRGPLHGLYVGMPYSG